MTFPPHTRNPKKRGKKKKKKERKTVLVRKATSIFLLELGHELFINTSLASAGVELRREAWGKGNKLAAMPVLFGIHLFLKRRKIICAHVSSGKLDRIVWFWWDMARE